MFVTTFMGLTAWDLETDDYDFSQQANNWKAVDQHDHTTGKGVQIPAAGLRDNAVVTAKIAPDAVTPDKIPNQSLTGQEIANGAIATDHLVDSAVVTPKIANGAVTGDKIDPNFLPVGSVIAWYRPNSSVALPTGWEVCDGRAWSGITNDWGVTTGNIPNLANKFILGAAVTGVGTDPASPPDIGAIGGSHTRNFAHSHVVNAHSHGVNPHVHGITSDGNHKHRFITTVWDANGNPVGTTFTDANQRGTAVPGSAGTREAFYVPDLNRNQYYGENVGAPMETTGAHSHGGITIEAGSTTDAQAPGTNSQLSNGTDVRPAFVGLLYIMKVRAA